MFTEQHATEVIKTSSVKVQEADRLLKKYPLRDKYTCKDKDIHLNKGDIIEVLDTENDKMWLVRLEADKEKVREVHISTGPCHRPIL